MLSTLLLLAGNACLVTAWWYRGMVIKRCRMAIDARYRDTETLRQMLCSRDESLAALRQVIEEQKSEIARQNARRMMAEGKMQAIDNCIKRQYAGFVEIKEQQK